MLTKPFLVPMLSGSELLARVRELDGVSKSEMARSCGYVSIKKDGTERVSFTAFYEALLAAKGVDVGMPSKAGRSSAGRKLSFVTKVQFNGNLLVGKAYTGQLDLKPGDEFEIKLGRKHITLVPVGSATADSGTVPEEEAAACVFGVTDVTVPTSDQLGACNISSGLELAAVA